MAIFLAWKNAGWLWIGGKKDVDGAWKWFRGTVRSPMHIADFEQVQPNGNGDCVQIFDQNRASTNPSGNSHLRENWKMDDTSCGDLNNFVCEKRPRRRG